MNESRGEAGTTAIRHGAVILLMLVFGCRATSHSIEPYASDADQAAAVEARAAAFCSILRNESGPPDAPARPFTTDGCSAWPDGESTTACCVEHDIAYWCGGSAEDRLAADDRFGECVASESGSAWLGAFMRAGVRLGGHPIFPTSYRWGYGDDYRGGYPE